MPLQYVNKITPDTAIGIWHCTEDAESMSEILILDPADEQILATLRNPNRKLQWLGCRMILTSLLHTRIISIRYDNVGKPALLSPLVNLSFSHSFPYAVAIISNSFRVGVDIERVRAKIRKVADRFLSATELDLASGSDQVAIYTLFWSVKEAVYKIHGKPDLNIQLDICIESFDYLCAGAGSLTARMILPDKERTFPVNYLRFDDWMVVWALDPGEP